MILVVVVVAVLVKGKSINWLSLLLLHFGFEYGTNERMDGCNHVELSHYKTKLDCYFKSGGNAVRWQEIDWFKLYWDN